MDMSGRSGLGHSHQVARGVAERAVAGAPWLRRRLLQTSAPDARTFSNVASRSSVRKIAACSDPCVTSAKRGPPPPGIGRREAGTRRCRHPGRVRRRSPTGSRPPCTCRTPTSLDAGAPSPARFAWSSGTSTESRRTRHGTCGRSARGTSTRRRPSPGRRAAARNRDPCGRGPGAGTPSRRSPRGSPRQR